jgi:hypothetical protein
MHASSSWDDSSAIPTDDELDRALQDASGGGDVAASAGSDISFDLMDLENALAAGEGFEFESAAEEEEPSLRSLIALAERYPGLKVSISF